MCEVLKKTEGILPHLTLSQTRPFFFMPAVQVFWKHWGERRNCSYRAISPFPTMFSTLLKNFLRFSSNLTHSWTTKIWPCPNWRHLQAQNKCYINDNFCLWKRKNIVRKGENAGNQCFENASVPDASKGVIVWEWVKIVVCKLFWVWKSLRLVIWETVRHEPKMTMQ